MTWLGGPTVWALHFAVVYGAESLACTRAGAGAHTLLATAATVVALGAIAVLVVHALRRSGFLANLAVMLGVASFAGVLAVYLPILMIPACLPPA